jgi:ubiquitin-like modifier-activating enzyme 5
MVPGRTACFQCAPPLIVASEISEKTLKRDGVCAASLPTTMGLVAALLAQATLKYLLGFGKVSCFLGYNALSDFFPTDVLRPNPDCTNAWCRKRQEEAKAKGIAYPPGTGPEATQPAADKAAAVVHESNEWGIEIVSADDPAPMASQTMGSLATGIEYAYEVPAVPTQLTPDVTVHTDEAAGIEDLAAQLKALQAK